MTIDEEPRDPEPLPDVHAMLARRGPFACRCGAPLEHPGCCEECSTRWEQRQFDELMAPARETVPKRFRWASFATPYMCERRPPLTAHVAVEAIRAVLAIRSPMPLGVALVGPSEAGKTTLACAMLRRIHDWATPDRPHAGVERARRAYFVDAGELAQPSEHFGVETPVQRIARAATVLVVDNVEPGSIKDAVGRTIMGRHNAQRPTIITTWMGETEAAKHFGGGWARRAYEATIDLGAIASRKAGAA